jgi:hypothetical protein
VKLPGLELDRLGLLALESSFLEEGSAAFGSGLLGAAHLEDSSTGDRCCPSSSASAAIAPTILLVIV